MMGVLQTRLEVMTAGMLNNRTDTDIDIYIYII